MNAVRLLELDPKAYKNHLLHGEDRAWTETNCYVDLWVELLHGMGYEPLASFAFTVTLDYEGDGFTFFKQPLEDLYELYGLDVMEHNIWRSLPLHIVQQLERKRPVLVELDSYYLPDTAGVSYQIEHTKTSVAVVAIDPEAQTLGYFHGRGYHELKGSDYRNVFRLDAPADAVLLPPYTEIVKMERAKRLSGPELAKISVAQLRRHLLRRPAENPVRAWTRDFARDLEWMKSGPLQLFHQYSFAVVRQLGSCAECASTWLRWLEQNGETGLAPAAAAFETLSGSAKTLQFRVARAVNTKKPWDAGPSLQTMAESWDAAMDLLVSRYAP